MRYIFNFPDIGEGLEEGIVIEWLVKKGQQIKSGDLLVTMETDKVVAEIPSPKTGTVTALFGKPGETVRVGEALVEIEIEEAEGSKPEPEKEVGSAVVGTLEVAGTGAIMRASAEGFENNVNRENKSERKALATPVARAMAKDFGIDINKVTGTGPAGRVMKEDIEKYANNSKKNTALEPQTHYAQQSSNEQLVEIEPMSQIRKTIAKNMVLSKRNAAHMTLFDEVIIDKLDEIRKKYKQESAQKGIKLTYLAFVIKSVALALKHHKSLNSEMDFDGGKMLYKKFYNIGIAVDTEKGLVVPVIKNADKLSIADIAKEIDLLSEKARDGKLTMDDFKNGTFTVTSYGSIGGKFAVPVINYPQAGILGIGRVSKQPIVKDDKLDIGLVMPLSISVDHRIVDGGEVTRFLNKVMSYLSDPVSIIME